MRVPQVTFTKVPVIALALSEAMMVATFATSVTIGNRRNKAPLLASAKNFSSVTPAALACSLNTSWTSGVSGDPAERRRKGPLQAKAPGG